MNPETYDTVWDASNDYSYDDLVSFEDDNDAAAITEKITLYADGKLVWGVEPDGTVAGGSEEPSFWGDANCDGKVEIADATLILQYLTNKDEYKLTAQGMRNSDVIGNSDGVTAQDALVIQQLDAGIYKQTDLPIKSK